MMNYSKFCHLRFFYNPYYKERERKIHICVQCMQLYVKKMNAIQVTVAKLTKISYCWGFLNHKKACLKRKWCKFSQKY